MSKSMMRKLKVTANSLIAAFLVVVVSTFNTSPAMAYAGTLENGNLAYAQGSGFDKGEACDYLPGFETGYDAWHFVLTSRGATFQQLSSNPAIAINLNFVYMRQDGSLFVIKSGAWVQTGKGAYTYTRVEDKIRMVQAGTVAQINGLDSGMRLSHTCPGSGVAPAATTSPTPTPTATRSSTPTPTATTASPSASATPTPSATSASPTPSSTPSSTVVPTLRPRPTPTASAVQVHPTGSRSPLPTPTATPQGLTPTPTPSTSPSRSATPTPSNTPAPSNSPEPTPSQEPSTPPTLPTPPPVEDPKDVIYVDPQTPKEVIPVEPPSSPIVITKQPEYGKVEVNPTGTITYTPPAVLPPTPVVDVVEFRYTNLAGQTVVVRKEFIVTQKGDVPSIIQTGFGEANNYNFLIGLALILLVIVGIRRGKSYE